MAGKGFAHLHLHTEYSLLDGAISTKKLFKRCGELGMDSVAITDHGNMFGAVEFYMNAISCNVKPIIGLEAYIAPLSRFEKQPGQVKENAYHLILLAENNIGYKNLLKLSSYGYTEGYYYRPRIDKELLKSFNEGIICTSACIGGEVPRLLCDGQYDRARLAAESFLKIFGDKRYYIEIQQHQDEEPGIREGLIDLANKLGIGIVATNDVHFLRDVDYEAHDALTCISTGKVISDVNRMKYPPDVYLKSSEEMRQMFVSVEQACDNTLDIAKRCNVEIDLKTTHAPKYLPKDGSKADSFLRKLTYEGAEKRYGNITDKIKNRIERELDVITSKGFASYFLVVWDFCNYAAENNIPVGARGSGVGTIVGYCLGLCNIDPLKYDLLFERFMDPERNEFPDIDIDICQDGREKIIGYVRQKYGHVAQIITFGTMKAKLALRDVCRVFDIPLKEVDRLTKLIPSDLDITLEKALESEPELKKEYEENEQIKKVFDVAQRLEGLARHAGVHAAGVIVADEDLTNFLPLYIHKSEGDQIITQFEGPIAEKVGMLKMDFLGLKTLSVISRACELVEQLHGIKVDIENIDIADQNVYKLFAQGKTKGVFQFESGGMQDMLIKLRPDRLEDLIAANALYRPGPMDLIPDYIERKHGKSWDVPHPIMKSVLDETFGIMVYQEQVMRICNLLGDIPLRQAYTLIKAISKKQADKIAKEKQLFVTGCKDKGLKESQANDIFELIERFAGYGFNKSHSTRYSFIAYQTGYLKTYWPVEFMAALLTYEKGNTDKVVEYISEAKQMNIEIAPPDINESFVDFTVVRSKGKSLKGDGLIRFGLAAVKGVGAKAVEQIITAREKTGLFKSLFHFCENVDLRVVNKQVIESSIKAGAFDRLGGSRSQMMAGFENAMQYGSRMQSDLSKGQGSLFGAMDEKTDFANDHKRLPDIAPWPEAEMLAKEKEVLGLYVTSNPLSKYAEKIQAFSTCNTSNLSNGKDGSEIIIGGMITNIKNVVTKNGKNAGQKMAILSFADLQGECEVVLFPKKYAEFTNLIDTDKVVFIRGKVDTSREKPNILADEVVSIEQCDEKLKTNIILTLYEDSINKELINQIASICKRHKGKCPVRLKINTQIAFVVANAQGYTVQPDMKYCQTMRELLGADNFELCGE